APRLPSDCFASAADLPSPGLLVDAAFVCSAALAFSAGGASFAATATPDATATAENTMTHQAFMSPQSHDLPGAPTRGCRHVPRTWQKCGARYEAATDVARLTAISQLGYVRMYPSLNCVDRSLTAAIAISRLDLRSGVGLCSGRN